MPERPPMMPPVPEDPEEKLKGMTVKELEVKIKDLTKEQDDLIKQDGGTGNLRLGIDEMTNELARYKLELGERKKH